MLAACGTDRNSSSTSLGSATSATSATGSTVTTRPPTSTTSVTAATTNITSTTRPPTLEQLGEELRGRLIRQIDDDYDRARLLFDPEFDERRPAAVVEVADATDVQRCVDFAARSGMPITARSGGHSYIGSSTVNDGLVVDLRGLSGVASLSSERASVGSGAALIDVYAGLAATGQAIPAGTCPTVGIGGLTLGGGVGVTARAWGLTCDNLVAADVVVADGRLVRASAEENDDLFWALRGGGGGTAGIVTGFEFATHRAVDVVTFVLRWDPAAVSQVLPAWLGWAPAGPDELWSNCIYGHEPDLELRMVGAWLGDEAALEALIDQLELAAGVAATSRSVATRSFLDAMKFMAGCSRRSIDQCRLDAGNGGSGDGELGRAPFAAKSAYLGSVPDDAGIAAMIDSLDRDLSPPGADSITLLFDSNGGAIARRPVDDTAFPHRDTIASIQYYGSWNIVGPEGREPTTTWLTDAHDHARPWTTGGAYVNYLDPGLEESDQAYFGANRARLAEVKRSWDPDRLFDVGQIIATD